jgi:hypothetical protein
VWGGQGTYKDFRATDDDDDDDDISEFNWLIMLILVKIITQWKNSESIQYGCRSTSKCHWTYSEPEFYDKWKKAVAINFTITERNNETLSCNQELGTSGHIFARSLLFKNITRCQKDHRGNKIFRRKTEINCHFLRYFQRNSFTAIKFQKLNIKMLSCFNSAVFFESPYATSKS